jgi:hypothetical protein
MAFYHNLLTENILQFANCGSVPAVKKGVTFVLSPMPLRRPQRYVPLRKASDPQNGADTRPESRKILVTMPAIALIAVATEWT